MVLIMDTKRIVKQFIDYICDWVIYENKKYGHTYFSYTISDNSSLYYIVADKGIEKRIEKQLNERLNMNVNVRYSMESSEYRFSTGELNIKIDKISLSLPIL